MAFLILILSTNPNPHTKQPQMIVIIICIVVVANNLVRVIEIIIPIIIKISVNGNIAKDV